MQLLAEMVSKGLQRLTSKTERNDTLGGNVSAATGMHGLQSFYISVKYTN